MKILLDFFPILLFVGAFKLYDIYIGTAVLMATTLLQTAILYGIDRKLQAMQKITLCLVLVFGTLTLALHDERFIMWKPTVMYVALALALAVATWVLHRNLIKMLLGSQLALPDGVWHRLNVAWVGYCVFMASLNAYVVLNFSTETWVNFKVWGFAFPLVFIVAQGIYIAPQLQATESTDPEPKP